MQTLWSDYDRLEAHITVESEKDKRLIKIDFDHRATEAGWCGIMDNLGLRGTPVWFTWLKWVLVLGAQLYLFKQSYSVIVGLSILISVVMLWLYFWGFFYRLEFANVPLLRRLPGQQVVSIVLSGVLASLFFHIAWLLAITVLRHR